MAVQFESVPTLFSPFHIIMLAAAVCAAVGFSLLLKNKTQESMIKLLGWMGIGMLIAEVWKQWFAVRYVYPDAYNMWFFPWQLCSLAMYCCALIPVLKKKQQDTLLVFLSTFSLLAAIMALLVPADMLRPQILFTLHGFLYHIFMILESLLAIAILKKRNGFSFKPALLFFLVTAFIAELINIFGHFVLPDRRPEPNMFQITFFYPTTQPGLSWLAETLGIIPEIIIYLLLIISASYGIYKAEIFFFTKSCIKWE